MIIKNREAVVSELTKMLIEFAKSMNSYQTDVYAYYIEETEEVVLTTFVNVGGNSWLKDDHYTIYTDEQHNETIFDSYDNIGDLLACSTNYDTEKAKEIERTIAKELEIDELDNYNYFDVRDYIKNNDELMENLTNNFSELIGEMESDFAEEAEEIISRFEEEIEADIKRMEKLRKEF